MKEEGVPRAFHLICKMLDEIILNDLPPSNEIQLPHNVVKGKTIDASPPLSPTNTSQLHASSLPPRKNRGSPQCHASFYALHPKSSAISSPTSFTIGKSESFEEVSTTEEAFLKAKSIFIMGNSSLALYLQSTLTSCDMKYTKYENDIIKHSNAISALSTFLSQRTRPGCEAGLSSPTSHSSAASSESWNKHRFKSKSYTVGTYSPTTSGQTYEIGSHTSISSKNSSPLVASSNERVVSISNDLTLNTISVNVKKDIDDENSPHLNLHNHDSFNEDYIYDPEAVLSNESDIDLHEEDEDESDHYENNVEAKKQSYELGQHISSHQLVITNTHSLESKSKVQTNFTITNQPSSNKRAPQSINGISSPRQRRVQMFGSEYARFLCSSIFSPSVPRKKNSIMRSLSRIKEHKSIPSIPNPTMPSSSSNTFLHTKILENASEPYLTGPITDMIITIGNELPPKGFYRISQTAEGSKADLTNKCGGTSIYLNVKKEANWDRAAQRPSVTSLAIVFPDRQEFVPPGYAVVRRMKNKSSTKRNSNNHNSKTASHSYRSNDTSIPANLNYLTNGERVYLCFKKSREGNPITGIIPLQPGRTESIPDGYTVLERTPRSFVADINCGAGSPLFLAFRQRLSNLETLRPQPLLRSQMIGPTNTSLQGYFCTGGTVVKSQVGGLHIMDRSTHTMLSPSSVTNRLQLIQTSGESHDSYDTTISNKHISRRRTSHSPAKNRGLEHMSSNVTFVDSGEDLADNESTGSNYTSRTIDDKNRVLTWQEFRDEDDESLIAFDFIPAVTDGTGENLCNPSKVEVITPILTACYTHHGGVSMLAVEGLTTLLKKTDFFDSDRSTKDSGGCFMTLLDLCVQVVCDVATSSSRETHFSPCVDFVSSAIRFARGNLGPRTLGYALRFYLFIFHFGASAASPSSWPHSTRLPSSHCLSSKNFNGDVPLLLDMNTDSLGSPQVSALSLKEMMSLILKRLQVKPTNKRSKQQHLQAKKERENETIEDFVQNLIKDVIYDSVDRVDVTKIIDLAIHQIQRSGGSELFWHDMISSCGHKLFGTDSPTYVLSFAILAHLVKVGAGNIRRLKRTGHLVPRDVVTKLLTLESILHFMDCANPVIGDTVTTIGCVPNHVQVNQKRKVLSYTIRRLIVPLVLNNTTAGLEDLRVFRRLLKIVANLWSSYRIHLKVEIAVLFEHFLLRVLRMGPQVHAFQNNLSRRNQRVCLDHQLDVLCEVEQWVQNPIDLLELFINYDMGQSSSITHWKACDHICSALCKLAEQCGEIIAQQINSSRKNNETRFGNTTTGMYSHTDDFEKLAITRDSARSLQEKSLDVICHIIRIIMDASHQAYNRKRKGHRTPKKIVIEGSWESSDSFPKIDFSAFGVRSNSTDASESKDYPDDYSDTSFSSVETSASLMRQSEKNSGIMLSPKKRTTPIHNPTNEIHSPKILMKPAGKFSPQSNTHMNRLKPPEKPPRHPSASNIFRSPITPRKHKSKVDELEADRRRTQETLKVAFEIIDNKNNGLKKGLDYLIACNFLLPGPRDVASFLQIHKKRLDPEVLGEYLGEGGHAGDGEYWNLIRYHFTRATSFVGMNVEKGLRIFLTKCGFRIPGEAQKIDRLISTFAQCFWEDNAGDHTTCPFQHRDTVIVVAFAIIMLNTDLHRANTARKGNPSKKNERKKMTRQEFITNLRGADEAKNVSKSYLSEIYDSIQSYPIELHGHKSKNSTNSPSSQYKDAIPSSDWFTASSNLNVNTVFAFMSNVNPALELLRGLALHEHEFLTARDHSSALSCEFLYHVFKSLWHHFYGVVNATLDAVQLDPQSIGSCVSVLRYAICTAIYLDMELERNAFVTQLARIKYLKERGLEDGARIGLSQQETNFIKGGKFKNEKWYRQIEDVSLSHEKVLAAVEEINLLTRELRRAMQIDSRLNQDMHKVTRRIRNGEILLSDPTRSFVREGDLLKRCNRSGRFVLYKFFLFSDVLIYAHKSSTRGDYKIHEELPLYLMKITSVANRDAEKKRYCFKIQHPKKSFLVCAPSAESKTRWMEDITSVISSSLDRKAGVHGARIGSMIR